MDKFLLSIFTALLCLLPARAADVVESFSSFSAAADTWLPTSGAATEKTATSTITKLEWTYKNVFSQKNNSKICMVFPKGKKGEAYMQTNPGIKCSQIKIHVVASGSNGGMDIYVGNTSIAHKDTPSAANYIFDIPAEYQNGTTVFKLVNTCKSTATSASAKEGNQTYVNSITFIEAESPVAMPVISFDETNNQVSISCETEGASVYYTIDNTDPTESSTKYNAPFTIERTTTVKAVAIKDGSKSEIAELLCPVPENALVEVDSNMTDWVRVGESVEVKFTTEPVEAAQYVVITTEDPSISVEKNAEGKWMLTGIAVKDITKYTLTFAEGCGYVDISDPLSSGIMEVVPGRPVADPAPDADGFINIKEGDSVTFSCAGAEKIFVQPDGKTETAYTSPHTMTFPTIGDYVVSVFPVKGENKDYEDKYGLIEGFKIKVAEKPAVTTTTFELVKNGETFEDGDKVLVITKKDDGTYYAMTNSTANSKITAKAVTVTNNVITLEDGQTDYGVLTVMEGTDANAGKFALKGSEGYVNGSSSNTNTSFGTTAYYSTVTFPTKNADNVKWYIQSDRYILGYNGTDFRGYKNDQTGQPIYIFRAVVNPISFAAKAGSHYLHEDNSAWDGYLGFSNPKNLPVTVTSSDEYVATVNELGEVFPKHVGTTVITATATKGEGENMKTYTASYTLSVGLDGTIGEGEVAIPAVYDAYENFYKSSDFEIFDTQYLLVEHLPGYTLHYSYVKGDQQGNTGVEKAPARAAAAETTDMHDVVEGTDRTAIKIYPYGKELDNPYNGTITVWAEKDGVKSAERTIAIGVPTGVDGIEADGADGAEYYTLQGVRVANPDKGIYIRVLNGKAVKVAL